MKVILVLAFLLQSATLFAQNEIRGQVKDNQGIPLEGTTILIENTSTYALTDTSGNFALASTENFPLVLSVRYMGYKPNLVTLNETPKIPLEIILIPDGQLDEIIVTSRRRSERAQDVPIPISVIGGADIEKTGSFNVNLLKERVPTVQLYSSNPRNTTLNIRGMGSTFGLTNDGIDPGVGFYVDGVYHARPAVTTLDFIDVEQIEILRGPQGTLFGKNTTAGAFNITTRKPSFTEGANFELSYGNYGFIQAKASITGTLVKNKLAGRLSLSGTQRDGTLYNSARDEYVNDQNNLGFRAQFLYTPSDAVKITLAADASRQRPNGYAQVLAGVVTTQRPEFRQFENIIADLNYSPASRNPFDRIIDHDTPWRSRNDLGGISLTLDASLGPGTLTSISAFRYWEWGPSNDRDFTGLPVLSLSQAPSIHKNWSQEIRYAGNLFSNVSGVIGIFAMGQNLRSDPFHTEESGAVQWRFSQNTQDPLWETPLLLDGYGIKTTNQLKNFSGAVFMNLDWQITERIHVLPGLRFNYDAKNATYDRQTYGGLQTTDPELLALKNQVYSDQSFVSDVDDTNLSGQLTLSYSIARDIKSFATFSTSYKPVGINLGGLPTENGEPILALAEVKPEYVKHYEIGVKSKPNKQSTLNLAVFSTTIDDFQTVVQTAELGVNRGYLANAEKVRVCGFELDGDMNLSKNLSFNGAMAYTDGKYLSFTNAPVPLEEVGGDTAFKDISGGRLPGISTWTVSLGSEISSNESNILNQQGTFFFGLHAFARSSFSSSSSPSAFLNIPGYALVNGRFGFKIKSGLSVFVWAHNILDRDYFEQLLPASGSAGHYAAVLGDPRMYGITLRHSF